VDTSTIVILDFGSQYTQLIERRIREFNVFSIVLPCTASLEQVRALQPKGLILSLIVTCVLLFTGWKGWEMVYRHRVGVADETNTGAASQSPRRAA